MRCIKGFERYRRLDVYWEFYDHKSMWRSIGDDYKGMHRDTRTRIGSLLGERYDSGNKWIIVPTRKISVEGLEKYGFVDIFNDTYALPETPIGTYLTELRTESELKEMISALVFNKIIILLLARINHNIGILSKYHRYGEYVERIDTYTPEAVEAALDKERRRLIADGLEEQIVGWERFCDAVLASNLLKFRTFVGPRSNEEW